MQVQRHQGDRPGGCAHHAAGRAGPAAVPGGRPRHPGGPQPRVRPPRRQAAALPRGGHRHRVPAQDGAALQAGAQNTRRRADSEDHSE